MSTPTAFARIAAYHRALGLPPLNAMPAPWVATCGKWTIKVNGTPEAVDDVPPFHAACTHSERFGVIAVSPSGGTMLGMWEGAEDELIEAIDEATRAVS